MAKTKKELQAKIRQISKFEKLSKQIEMTITNGGIRVELPHRVSIEGHTDSKP